MIAQPTSARRRWLDIGSSLFAAFPLVQEKKRLFKLISRLKQQGVGQPQQQHSLGQQQVRPEPTLRTSTGSIDNLSTMSTASPNKAARLMRQKSEPGQRDAAVLGRTQQTSAGRTLTASLSSEELPGKTRHAVDDNAPAGSRPSSSMTGRGAMVSGSTTMKTSTSTAGLNAYGQPIAGKTRNPTRLASSNDALNSAMLDAGDSGERIKVCVRKRPLSGRELQREERDIVDVASRRTVIVHEPK